MNRNERFVGASDFRQQCDSAIDPEHRVPFFGGVSVKSRMDQVRAAIIEIRMHWDRYHELASHLREKLERERDRLWAGLTDEKREEHQSHLCTLNERLRLMFASEKGWPDWPVARNSERVAYEVVRLYTSELGYALFQMICKDLFRQFSTPAKPELITASFLIELLNIDLYTYCLVEPSASDFEGVVYRGLKMTVGDFRDLSALVTKPLFARYFSIPMGIDSSSRSWQRATRFAETPGALGCEIPVVHKIHVLGLASELKRVYQERVGSKISTICAVPIRAISDHGYEDEILLRGPFFQVLRIGQEKLRDGTTVHIVESAMLNSNRDHPSTPQTGVDDEARKLFATMVGLRRNEFCAQFCRENGLVDNQVAYQQALDSTRIEYRRLARSDSPI